MATAYPQQHPHPGAPPHTFPPNGAGGPPPHGGPPGGPPGVVDSYFTESRKGEVNELRQLLRNFGTERDPMRKREIIKKVIAYMTLGIDVSRLFTEMMLAIETRDLVIKKMVYLFLCNYATSHPELAQMCTNTLQKDCSNDDPMVRGLALRALCSLRLPQMVEYISEPLRKSLTDAHAYVRKTGVMGILKLHHLDPDACANANFMDILYDLLRDPDAQVVTNCILVLNEIMSAQGGMAINRAIMLHLLNRLPEFSEFGMVAVLDLVPRYIPATEEEGFQIMNLLDPVLRTSHTGAFMSTIRAFLSLAQHIGGSDVPAMRRQVVGRVRAPLITLVAGGSSEQVHALLHHVDSLIEVAGPGIFDDEYRQFYVRYNEPTHVQYLKVSLLPKLANPDNAPDIVAELAEYVSDVDAHLGRLAVRAMARIACRDVGGPGCAESIARRLVDMLDLDVPHVSSEAAVALVDVSRRHPSLGTIIAPPLPRALKYMTESSGRAAVITLLGEYGDTLLEAPYSIEKLIDSYDGGSGAGGDEADGEPVPPSKLPMTPEVKIALLTTTLRLFFKRPPEVQKMLGRLLAKATEDVSSQDLHDRALFYYRLLRKANYSHDQAQLLQSIVSTTTTLGSSNFVEEDDLELRSALLQEFNSLSIVYGTTCEHFIAPEYQIPFTQLPEEHPLQPPSGAARPAPVPEPEAPPPPPAPVPAPEPASVPAPAPPAPAPAAVVDLLGFGDEPSPAPPVPASALAPAPPEDALLVLDPHVTLSGDEYQSKWGAVEASQTFTIPLAAVPSSTAAVEAPLTKAGILTMASGDLPTELKFFLYAQSSQQTMYLLQSSISKSTREMSLVVKVVGNKDAADVDMLVAFVTSALESLG